MTELLPTLSTPRLRLRALRAADVPALFEIFSDREVMRYWSHGPLADRAAAEALLADIERRAREGTLYQWGVARADDDRVVGTCTLAEIERSHRRASIGYALGRRDWGQGYAREAVGALIAHAFGALDLHRLEADVDPRNEASIRVVEHFGFVREGHLSERYLVQGELQDAVLFGLLRRTWQARNERAPDPSRAVVRACALADRPRVLELLETQLAEHRVAIDRPVLRQALEGLLDQPERGLVLVADEGAGPIGIACLSFTWTLECGGRVAWLEELYVGPEARERSLGTQLLRAAIEQAERHGARAIDLEVDSDHARVATLYQRHDFGRLSRSRWQRASRKG